MTPTLKCPKCDSVRLGRCDDDTRRLVRQIAGWTVVIVFVCCGYAVHRKERCAS